MSLEQTIKQWKRREMSSQMSVRKRTPEHKETEQMDGPKCGQNFASGAAKGTLSNNDNNIQPTNLARIGFHSVCPSLSEIFQTQY